MSTLRRSPFRPMEAPPPNVTVPAFQEALRKAISEASKRETGVVRFVPGCDGRPVVTAYQGPCQDQARAVSGGQAAVAVDLGNGARVVVARDLGRGYSASSGYQGAGLASGAFPSPVSPGASDLALDPIDSVSGVSVEGEPSDIGSSLIGAEISGKTGEGRFTAYGITTGNLGGTTLYYWADATAADPPVEVASWTYPDGLLLQIEMVSPTRAVAMDAVTATLHFFENGVEAGAPYHIAEFDASHPRQTVQGWYFAIIPGTGGNEAIVSGLCDPALPHSTRYGAEALAHVSGLLDGSVVVEHFWKRTEWEGDYYPVSFAGPSCMGSDGTVYGVGEKRVIGIDYTTHLYYTGRFFAWRWAPPYTSAPEIWWEELLDPPPWPNLGVSLTHPIHITVQSLGASYFLTMYSLQIVNGPTVIQSYATVPGLAVVNPGPGLTSMYDMSAFHDDDGNLWVYVEEDGSYSVAIVEPPFTSSHARESISLAADPTASGEAYRFTGRHTSGDRNAIFMLSTTPEPGSPYGFSYLRAPFRTGAEITNVPSPHPTESVAWLTLPHAEWFDVAADLTVNATSRSVAPDGGTLAVVTRLTYANGGPAEAWGLRLVCPLPDGMTFLSATDNGHYRDDKRTVTWYLDPIAAGGSGFVEMTLRR